MVPITAKRNRRVQPRFRFMCVIRLMPEGAGPSALLDFLDFGVDHIVVGWSS